MVWDLRGNEQQNAIVRDALDRCDFPFDLLRPGLQQSVNKTAIPVEWADLSRYAQAEVEVYRQHDDHEHDHADDTHGDEVFHIHIEEDGDKAHGIGFRNAVLGLAWYSGKITLENTLVNRPEVAKEIFLSEGAHMVDFFYMTDEHRRGVWNAVHTDVQDLPEGVNIEDAIDLGHGHGWFDVGGYYSWVGEAFMGLFVKAFSDVAVTIPFHHPATPEASQETRYVFMGDETPVPEPEPEVPDIPEEPAPEPEEPVVPEEPVTPEPDDGDGRQPAYFGVGKSKVFHDSHKGIAQHVSWESYEAAVNDGRRPCKVCKPGG